MAIIATCPQCARELGLSAAVAMTDRVECPECRASFSLSKTRPVSLSAADVLDPIDFHFDFDLPKSAAFKEESLDLTLPDSFFDTPPSNLPEELASANVKHAAVSLQAVSGGRVQRRSLPSMAAFVAGPVLASLLGLYGLHWLQAKDSDSRGRAKLLPKSVLSSLSGDSSGEPQLTEVSGERLEKENLASMSPARTERVPSKGSSMVITSNETAMSVSIVQPATTETSITLITASEFSVLVEDANSALPAMLTGDLSTRDSVRRKGQAFMALCRLAEQLDFANQVGLPPAVQAQVRQARQVFQQVTDDPVARRDLVRIAARWWDYQQRPNSGIFLLGRVHETQPAAAGTLCWVQVGDQSPAEAIPVLLKDPRFQTGDLIGVVGHVISDPQELPAGLSAGQIVRAVYGYRLDSGI